MTNFTREINRLLLALIFAFTLILLAAIYYAVIGNATLLQRDDNPRLVEAERSILRGGLYDRNGTPLALTTTGEDGFAIREYLYPAMNSALGYYSFRYGTGGIENIFDASLSGSNVMPSFSQIVLKQPQQGTDIRLTLDLQIQQVLYDAMDNRQGTAIVMTVPDGDILAMVSLPTYDPNTLDEDWESLIEDTGNPFFNRALQGSYQPGTLMQTPILISALVGGQPLTATFPNGTASVELEDLTISCVHIPQDNDITLREAYLYGCPKPFMQLVENMGVTKIRYSLTNLNLNTPLQLVESNSAEESVETSHLIRRTLADNALGQGEVNLSPLTVNTLTAAIVNNGNAPQPHVLMETRPPDSDTWLPTRRFAPTTAYTTAANAQVFTALLQEMALTGTATYEWESDTIGAQVALAYSGENTLVWFTGFDTLPNNQTVVLTIILENTDDISDSLQIAKATFDTTRNVLDVETIEAKAD